MAQAGNISEMLQSLLSSLNGDNSDNGGNGNNDGVSSEQFSSDGETAANEGGFNFDGFDFGSLFENIDIDMIMKLGELFSAFNRPDKNAELLRALKPIMRDENKDKIDKAMKLMKIVALWPFIKESGFMDKIF